MQLNLALEYLNRAKLSRPHVDLELFVRVFSPGSVGGTPCVKVESLQAGIDWDNGRVLLDTAQPLTTLSPQDIEAIRESVKKGESWHAYQAYKKQADRIKVLEAEVAGLKAGLLSK